MTYNIHINNNELKKVTHTNFLGVIIDENLTWERGGGSGTKLQTQGRWGGSIFGRDAV